MHTEINVTVYSMASLSVEGRIVYLTDFFYNIINILDLCKVDWLMKLLFWPTVLRYFISIK